MNTTKHSSPERNSRNSTPANYPITAVLSIRFASESQMLCFQMSKDHAARSIAQPGLVDLVPRPYKTRQDLVHAALSSTFFSSTSFDHVSVSFLLEGCLIRQTRPHDQIVVVMLKFSCLRGSSSEALQVCTALPRSSFNGPCRRRQ